MKEPSPSLSASDLRYLALTPARWPGLERLFGERGACGGCWCMWWRLKRAQFNRQKGAGNKRAFRRIVGEGPPPGIQAFGGSQPIGWCAVGPRENFPALDRSRILKKVDDRTVWSVVCLFVARPYRGQGVSVGLLRAAVEHARSCGAEIVEGYPVEPRKRRMADAFAWTGTASAFRSAGFVEVARRSPTRPIMRISLTGRPA